MGLKLECHHWSVYICQVSRVKLVSNSACRARSTTSLLMSQDSIQIDFRCSEMQHYLFRVTKDQLLLRMTLGTRLKAHICHKGGERVFPFYSVSLQARHSVYPGFTVPRDSRQVPWSPVVSVVVRPGDRSSGGWELMISNRLRRVTSILTKRRSLCIATYLFLVRYGRNKSREWAVERGTFWMVNVMILTFLILQWRVVLLLWNNFSGFLSIHLCL